MDDDDDDKMESSVYYSFMKTLICFLITPERRYHTQESSATPVSAVCAKTQDIILTLITLHFVSWDTCIRLLKSLNQLTLCIASLISPVVFFKKKHYEN